MLSTVALWLLLDCSDGETDEEETEDEEQAASGGGRSAAQKRAFEEEGDQNGKIGADGERLAIKRRRFRDAANIMELPDVQFQSLFRMNKDVFSILLNTLKPHLPLRRGCTSIEPIFRLSAFLLFAGSGNFQKCIGEKNLTCMSQPAISNVMSEVLEVVEKHFCPSWITFKTTPEEEALTKDAFYNKIGIPGVVGCVAGMHIPIATPKESLQSLYQNKENYYSINTIIVCDHNLVIRYVDPTHAGSKDVASIWECSELNTYLEDAYRRKKSKMWLIGDANFPTLPYLITPYESPTRPKEWTFNEKLSMAHKTIDRCCDALKGRFQCLNSTSGLHYSPKKVTQFVNVCSAIHNFCIQHKNPFVKEEPAENQEEESPERSANIAAEAIQIRDALADSLIT